MSMSASGLLYAWHMPGICHLLQVLTERFATAPRSDVYDKLRAGIFNISKKTGEQLLSMFRQLIIVGHGLIPCKDWEAMIAYVQLADMYWCDTYTEADFVLMEEYSATFVTALHCSSFIDLIGKVNYCRHTRECICQ